ncbi:hypothetical protein ABW19_dt0205746 [Dactylella cylindrospora]|nr:hypothetical protein ABW19_dt0205746 [Dactylella cylindrospora]
MSLPLQLRGATHLFSFLSLLASSRNATHSQCCRHLGRSYAQPPLRTPGIFISRRWYPSTRPARTGRAVRALSLSPNDKERIKEMFSVKKPRSLRTEKEYNEALLNHGYVPAIYRIDEMLDMDRSPYQAPDIFDKITLGLLLKTSRTIDGGIRNPYRIPDYPAGQNPVRTKNRKFPNYMSPARYFLFPDETNWSSISGYFPLSEPPRPWHPIVMSGMKQEYSKEEVARRLEWSMVRNAKCMRNGYHWAAPDPATYQILQKLPPPPPPVIRGCNTCHKPRYLMRFWNFYYQKWQHVTSPHRPDDCGGHARGSCGRIMYAPPKTKIGNTRASQIEDKDWIDEETAIQLLFRSGFIALPKINPELGKVMSQAGRNSLENYDWIKGSDALRWGMRGGRANGLVDLTNVRRMEDVEEAREEQREKFMKENEDVLQRAQRILQETPITPTQQATIPDGYLYPEDHEVTKYWKSVDWHRFAATRHEARDKKMEKLALKRELKAKLKEYEEVLEEMKVTKARILLLERGEGEVWADPDHSGMTKREKMEEFLARKTPEERKGFIEQQPNPDSPGPASRPNFSAFEKLDEYPMMETWREQLGNQDEQVDPEAMDWATSDSAKEMDKFVTILEKTKYILEDGDEENEASDSLVKGDVLSRDSTPSGKRKAGEGDRNDPDRGKDFNIRWGVSDPEFHPYQAFAKKSFRTFDNADSLWERELQKQAQDPSPKPVTGPFQANPDADMYAQRYRKFATMREKRVSESSKARPFNGSEGKAAHGEEAEVGWDEWRKV